MKGSPRGRSEGWAASPVSGAVVAAAVEGTPSMRTLRSGGVAAPLARASRTSISASPSTLTRSLPWLDDDGVVVEVEESAGAEKDLSRSLGIVSSSSSCASLDAAEAEEEEEGMEVEVADAQRAAEAAAGTARALDTRVVPSAECCFGALCEPCESRAPSGTKTREAPNWRGVQCREGGAALLLKAPGSLLLAVSALERGLSPPSGWCPEVVRLIMAFVVVSTGGRAGAPPAYEGAVAGAAIALGIVVVDMADSKTPEEDEEALEVNARG